LDNERLDYIKRLIEVQSEIGANNGYYYSKTRITVSHVNTFLRPNSHINKDFISILPYEDRVEIAKIYLERLIEENIFDGFDYYKNVYSPYSSNTDFKKLLSLNGYDCYVDILSKDEKDFPTDWITKNENFHQMLLERLYKKWDKDIENWKDENKQECVELMFTLQLSGLWLYYNGFNQNFLKVYLEYLKARGYKINIFELFKKKIDTIISGMEQGTSHFTKSKLFEALIITFDFYMAVLDLYGEDNKKAVSKLQNTLNYIFKEKLNVEKMGFMNTFLYTKYYDRSCRDSKDDVKYFWEKLYTSELNPTLKRIFINAFVYTWNKSPIPKVRNSIKLIADLSTYKRYIEGGSRGFPYSNQSIFYKDLMVNANNLKKSVKTILFSKAMTEEGGLYFGG